jgi:hypothetical protein
VVCDSTPRLLTDADAASCCIDATLRTAASANDDVRCSCCAMAVTRKLDDVARLLLALSRLRASRVYVAEPMTAASLRYAVPKGSFITRVPSERVVTGVAGPNTVGTTCRTAQTEVQMQ